MTPAQHIFPGPEVDDRLIYDIFWAKQARPVVGLSQEIGLLDLLAREPATIDQVASRLELSARAAEALIAVLAALGLLELRDRGRFAVTPVTREYLLTGSRFAWGSLMPSEDRSIAQLRRAVGEDRHVEASVVDMANLDDEQVASLIADMHRLTLAAATGLADLPVFSGVGQLLDVAGGSGSLSCALAQRHPRLRCTLLDLPRVCALARKNIERYGLVDRVELLAADMFEDDWPRGHDAVLFGNVFHDWDPETCSRLASRAFEALAPGGRILLHEMLLADGKDGPLLVACFSVLMLVLARGKQYTCAELRALLEDAGFVDFRVTPSFGYYSLVEARKPGRRSE